MGSAKRKKIENNRNIWLQASDVLKEIIDSVVYVYMALIIIIMPFYFTEGFKHIGTDKAMFFRKVSLFLGKFILPFFACYAVFWIIAKCSETRSQSTQTFTFRLLLSKIYNGFNLSVTDIFALFYALSLTMSYLFSDYRKDIFWGATGWYMGFGTQMILICVYFFVSRVSFDVKYIFFAIFPVSAVVFGLEILNRFSIYPIDMIINTNPSFVSTIGNINWFCGYTVIPAFAGFFLLWQCEKMDLKKVLLSVYMFIAFTCLITQGSNSGMLAFMIVCLIAYAKSGDSKGLHISFWRLMVLFSSACLTMVLFRKYLKFNFTYPGDRVINTLTNTNWPFLLFIIVTTIYIVLKRLDKKSKFPNAFVRRMTKLMIGLAVAMGISFVSLLVINTISHGGIGFLTDIAFINFDYAWGSGRGVTWRAGFECFREQNILHKLIGVGPDAMSQFIYNGASESIRTMVTGQFGDAALTNAHSEWLTVLTDCGIWGAVSYIGFVLSRILRHDRYENKLAYIIAGACVFATIAHTANCMISFQTAMNAVTIFVIMGIGENIRRKYSVNTLKYDAS